MAKENVRRKLKELVKLQNNPRAIKKQISVIQGFTTRPIEIYTEFSNLSESDFENIEKINQIYTDACEARFVDLLKRAINRYCETGEVPTLGVAMEDFDNGKF